jgi:MULE transposase domain
MKNVMGETMSRPPSSAQASVGTTLADHVLMALPRRPLLFRTLCRHRNKIVTAATGTTPLPAVPTDLNFTIPDEFAGMVLYDSGPADNRIILLGCPELLDGLARSECWLADGTFKVVSSILFQLYTIHFHFRQGMNPVGLYCLLSNKTEDTYDAVLHVVRRVLVPSASPGRILLDFERAAMNAFDISYPDAVISGCYFHICQSVLRKTNEVGLKAVYENDIAVCLYIRCLPALAFVPETDVLEAFDILEDSQPQDIDHLDELTSYFEHTYVRGRRQRGRGDHYAPALFPLRSWNQFKAGAEGIARTTNSVEGWHRSIQSLFGCHHPTLWKFLTGLKADRAQQKATFLQLPEWNNRRERNIGK